MENEGMANCTMNTFDEQITALKFERIGPDPQHPDVTLWLLSGALPDILVTQTREQTHASDVAAAIYAAGMRDKRDEIAGRHKAFLDAVRAPAVNELWVRARELQAQQREEMTAAASMPKTEPGAA
jgi:hypothetical protein